MRQNPPFNMDYITATFLLEKISNKTHIINDPFAVRNIPEKLFSLNLGSKKFKVSSIVASHDISFKKKFDNSYTINEKNLIKC